MWKQALDLFFRREYTPLGFDIGKNDTVVDIGAKKGMFVALAASYKSEIIYAFEPDYDNYNYLKALIDYNNLSSVTLFKEAVAEHNGQIKLNKSLANTRHSILGKDVLTGEVLKDFVSIPAISLDSALHNLPIVDLLKIDCEGAKYEIIFHAQSDTLNKIRRIVMEYHGSEESDEVKKFIQAIRIRGLSRYSPSEAESQIRHGVCCPTDKLGLYVIFNIANY